MSRILAFLLLGTLFKFFFASSVLAQVVINEFSVHSDPEWVEFYNASDSADYLLDYYLDDDNSFTDDQGSSKIKQLKDYALLVGNLPFTVVDLIDSEGKEKTIFNNDGDFVVLFDANGNLVDQYQYNQDPGKDMTMGRSPDRVGEFRLLNTASKGAINSTPFIAPSPSPSPQATPKAKTSPKETRQNESNYNYLPTPIAKTYTSASSPSRSASSRTTHSGRVLGITLGTSKPITQLNTNETISASLSEVAGPRSGVFFIFAGLFIFGSAGYMLMDKIRKR